MMEIRLNDDEIREALVEALARKVEYCVSPSVDECWFEVKAGDIDGNTNDTEIEVNDIHDVMFCYKTGES